MGKTMLGTASSFINRAADFGITLELDVYKTNGLQIYWLHNGTPEQIKALRKVFDKEGIARNHHFSKKK